MSRESLAEARELCRTRQWQSAAEACAAALEVDPGATDALHLLGLVAAQSGHPQSAAQLLAQAIHQQPARASFHNDLGVVQRKLGALQLARASYCRAIELEPTFAEAHRNLGNLLLEEGQTAAALKCYLRVLELMPGDAASLHAVGSCRRALGQRPEAIEALRQSIVRDPNRPTAHRDLGEMLLEDNESKEALGCFRRALRLDPGSSRVNHTLGALLLNLDRAAEAEHFLRKATELDPAAMETLTNLGRCLRKLKRAAEAEACFHRVLEVSGESVESLEDVGIALSDQKRDAEALGWFQRARTLAPDRAETHCNIAHAMLLQSQFIEARPHLMRALTLREDFPEAWSNLGGSYLGEGLQKADPALLERVQECYQRALQGRPDYVDVHSNLALLHLLRGRFEEGWREWEWRWHGKEAALTRFQRPQWQGESPKGQCVLLHTEGGFGDTFHFMRYATLLHRAGARVLIQCPKPLRSVLSGCIGVDSVLREGEPTPAFDLHCPLMSLPGLFRTTRESIPAPVPYLLANPDRIAYWRCRLGQYSGLKVGIVWQGNSEYKGDRRRSIPLAYFEPLAHVPGVQLFSLQLGFGREQLGAVASPWRIVDLALPWAETAAALMHLDLLITSDTAIAHLGGALGRPVWVALGYTPDWRWQLEREDSPWYPTMRLFRQPGPDQWPSVFANIAAQLREKSLTV